MSNAVRTSLGLISGLLAAMLFVGSARADEEVCSLLNGSSLIAQDDENTYLGKIASSFDRDSIFNEFGTYGSEFNSKSIWNQFGKFGSEFSAVSATNRYSSKPPMIIKRGKVIGYLSANGSVEPSISPNLLKALCAEWL